MQVLTGSVNILVVQHGASVRITLGFDEIKVLVPKERRLDAGSDFFSFFIPNASHVLIISNVVVLLCASVLARLRSFPRHG